MKVHFVSNNTFEEQAGRSFSISFNSNGLPSIHSTKIRMFKQLTDITVKTSMDTMAQFLCHLQLEA